VTYLTTLQASFTPTARINPSKLHARLLRNGKQTRQLLCLFYRNRIQRSLGTTAAHFPQPPKQAAPRAQLTLKRKHAFLATFNPIPARPGRWLLGTHHLHPGLVRRSTHVHYHHQPTILKANSADIDGQNYYATRYSAEIVNTLTNLLFIYLAFKGMHNCYRHGHDRIFFLSFVGYLIVGCGSFAFHSTLKYPMQLVDELSMIYTTCLMFWATFEHKRPWPVGLWLGFFTAGLAAFITAYYHYLQDPTFHQNAYAILTALVLLRSMYVMELNIRPYFRKRHETYAKAQQSVALSKRQKQEEFRKDQRDQEIIKQMWIMVGVGLSIFLGGFGIWNLDNIYCSKIRRWRHEIGLPWGILLEGHGWWHLMTGLGAYMYIVW
jgi:dihydroceramidase